MPFLNADLGDENMSGSEAHTTVPMQQQRLHASQSAYVTSIAQMHASMTEQLEGSWSFECNRYA